MSIDIAINRHFTDKLPPGDSRWAKFNDSFETATLDAAGLAQEVQAGHAFTAVHREHRHSRNFISAQHLALDCDHIGFAPLLSDPFIAQYASFLYTTPSHTPADPRTRVVFILDQPITDAGAYALAAGALTWKFIGEADSSCKDAARLFFGSKGCQVQHIGHILPLSVVQQIADEFNAALEAERARRQPRRDYVPSTPDMAKIAEALTFIPKQMEYLDWLHVGMGVASLFPGPDGIALCEAWSPGYPGEWERKFASFSATGNTKGRVGIGTVFHLAKENGWQQQRRNGSSPPEPEQPPTASHVDTSPLATWPYDIDDEQIVFLYRAKDEDGNWQIRKTPITTFTAHITEEITSENGIRYFTVHGATVHGHPFHFEIEAGEFSQTRLLKAAITQSGGASATVLAKQSEHLIPAIMRLSLPEQIRQTHRYDRTGWDGSHFLIPGRESEGVTIHLPRKFPACLAGDADLNTGLTALEAVIMALPPSATTILLAVIFQAPLALPAHWRNERYALFIRGRTGSLKTSWAQTAMSIYGHDFMRDDQIIKWGEGATRNAIMSLATRAHDLPLLIDNYKPSTGGGAKDFINLIHNILEGGEKDRLNRASELKETRPVFCWPICTGEDVPDSDPASLARILVVDFPWQDGRPNENLTIAQESAYHLSAIGRTWLDWVESETGQSVAKDAEQQFSRLRAQWAEYIHQYRPDTVNILRVASNLATNALTWWAVQQHPQLGDIAKRYGAAHQAGLADVAKRMAGHTAEALEAVRYLEALRELLSSGRCILLEKCQAPLNADQDKVIGWEDGGDGALLMPAITRQAVERVLGRDGLGGISDRTLYSQLMSLGHITSGTSDKTTKLIKVKGDVVRVLHLKASALAPDNEQAETQRTFP